MRFADVEQAPDLANVTSIAQSRALLRRTTLVTLHRLACIMRESNDQLRRSLAAMAPPASEVTFVRRAVASGHVMRSRDDAGRAGWTPRDALGIRFAERILSLVSVDRLMRPSDYLALFSRCAICETVSFDLRLRPLGLCANHAPTRFASS